MAQEDVVPLCCSGAPVNVMIADWSIDEGLPKASNLSSTGALSFLPQNQLESHIALKAPVSARENVQSPSRQGMSTLLADS